MQYGDAENENNSNLETVAYAWYHVIAILTYFLYHSSWVSRWLFQYLSFLSRHKRDAGGHIHYNVVMEFIYHVKNTVMATVLGFKMDKL